MIPVRRPYIAQRVHGTIALKYPPVPQCAQLTFPHQLYPHPLDGACQRLPSIGAGTVNIKFQHMKEVSERYSKPAANESHFSTETFVLFTSCGVFMGPELLSIRLDYFRGFTFCTRNAIVGRWFHSRW